MSMKHPQKNMDRADRQRRANQRRIKDEIRERRRRLADERAKKQPSA
jgi:hypothetical protein